jgi:protein-S-isoprenylcysteine O-methyltransferase Ste14
MMQRGKTVSALAWGLMMTLTVSQIASSFLLYNQAGFEALRNVGWITLWGAGFFGVAPIFTLRRRGGVSNGQSYIHTTILVDSGIYAVVRHPQYLSFMLLNTGLMLVAQHGLITVLGVAAIGLDYRIALEADREAIVKFGDDYRLYMDRVPRVNFLTGLVRLLRHRKQDR